jgi:hypothetical protein
MAGLLVVGLHGERSHLSESQPVERKQVETVLRHHGLSQEAYVECTPRELTGLEVSHSFARNAKLILCASLSLAFRSNHAPESTRILNSSFALLFDW